MENIFLVLFATACGGLLIWGMREPNRVYQYPFLIGAIFTAFLLPQAIALVDYPGGLPRSAVNQALFMGTLCMFMGWVGYQIRPLARVRMGEVRVLNGKRLYVAALITGLISLLSVYGMMGISEDEIRTGTGLFTIYAFFSGLAAISFPIFLSLAIWKPRFKSILLAIIAGYPIYSAIFIGRRTETAAFLALFAIIWFFHKRYVPPRIIALGGVAIIAFLIPVFAELRGDFWTALFSGNIYSIDWFGEMDKVLSGEIHELRNATVSIYSTDLTGNYGYGTGYWDAIIFRYVPGQLLGFEFKQSLQFNWTSDVYTVVGYMSPTGTTKTVIGDTYIQFGYFGSLFFLLQGYLFRNLWTLLQPDSPIGKLHMGTGYARFDRSDSWECLVYAKCITYCPSAVCNLCVL